MTRRGLQRPRGRGSGRRERRHRAGRGVGDAAGGDAAAARAGRHAGRAGRSGAIGGERRATVAPFALPHRELVAIAEARGPAVGRAPTRRRSARRRQAMAAQPRPARVPRERKPVATVDEGPLVLVETRKDLSQVKLPFETSSGRPTGPEPKTAHASAPPARPRRLFLASAQGRRSSACWYGGVVHQLVPGERRRLRQQGEARCLAVRVGLPAAIARGPRRGRRARRRRPRRRRPTGCTAAPGRSRPRARAQRRVGVGDLAPPMRRAPAMLRSSLKIAPSKPSCLRRMSCSQRAEKPAGRASTCG